MCKGTERSKIILYNLHRPKKFKDVVGQAAADTLLSFSRHKRVPHSLLFTGHRGVGKTSLARIYNLAINCKRPRDGEPCLRCIACRKPQLLEMDAGSNSTKDKIQNLKSLLGVVPKYNYTVVVLDEAHALSKAAQVTLLSMLEEPPAKTVLMLATTEPEKLSDALKSRCMWFPLHLIPLDKIYSTLRRIVIKEKIRVTRQALEVIAKEAEGSLRTAISLLDSLSGFGSMITSKEVKSKLAVVDISSLTKLILEPDLHKMISETERLVSIYNAKTIMLALSRELVDLSRDYEGEEAVKLARISYYINKEANNTEGHIIADRTHIQMAMIRLYEILGYTKEHRIKEEKSNLWAEFNKSMELGIDYGFYQSDLIVGITLIKEVDVDEKNNKVNYVHVLGIEVNEGVIKAFEDWSDKSWQWIPVKEKPRGKKIRKRGRR